MRSRYLRLMWTAPFTAILAVGVAASGPSPSEGPAVRAITGRTDGTLSTVLIEASEPVAYLTSQPDPLTVFVDLRNARTEGVPAMLAVSQPPVAGVRLEPAVAPDGAPVARVRVALSADPARRRPRAPFPTHAPARCAARSRPRSLRSAGCRPTPACGECRAAAARG